MCWSAEGSLKTYAAAMTLVAIHLFRGKIDPILLLFLVVFTQMQLVEYFLWKNLDDTTFWSRIGFFLLMAQTLVTAAMLPPNMRVAAWTIILAGTAMYLLTNKVDATTVVGDNGHLKWNWVPPVTSPWAWGWLVMLLGPFLITRHYYLLLFGMGTWIMSFYFNSKYGTLSSYWCWVAISGGLLPFLE